MDGLLCPECGCLLQGRPLWPSATYIINYYIHQVVTPLVADGHKGRTLQRVDSLPKLE